MPKHLSSEQIIGTKYGRLTIMSDLGKVTYTRMVEVKCICGVIKVVRLNGLRTGHTKSCGCYNSDLASSRQTTHGLSKHPLFTIWINMRQRCHWEKHKQYVDYGARGISVCSEWRTDFFVFYTWAIANGWKKGLTVDREDNDGDYEPSNCRLVTNTVQQRNKRTNVLYTIDGVTKCLSEWCEHLNLKYKIIHQRITRDKYTFEEAISDRYQPPLIKCS